MTTSQAAEELGVTSVAVRKLVGSGSLTASARIGRNILVDRSSVVRLKNRGTRVGRPWSADMAWGALAMLSGQPTGWIDASSRYRLRQRLRHLDAKELAAHVTTKDANRRYRVTPSAVESVAELLLSSGAAALRDSTVAQTFGLAGGSDVAEGYVLSSEVDQLVRNFAMVPDPDGNVTLRVIADPAPVQNGELPAPVIAVDLMDSLSSRERSAGEAVLEAALKKWQEKNHGKSPSMAR
ncbi:helix-turn-helix domain-containing protein [Arthrobacter wenxiniae]|jgi:excisionase family DNA binding protein|uniref:Helix-turn-helix domain-containing protein n=1 Tax=Arthrobacter wenxiniae TaxID=2713570 RepID=A0A7Y7LYG8_9MICC|nr:helix-turn-helix domain-containing protein [Arthrobacter wenxiniae]NVM93713.1 helix-turn-helix domain-containing protein [Arthrobacter wenxiniae]